MQKSNIFQGPKTYLSFDNYIKVNKLNINNNFLLNYIIKLFYTLNTFIFFLFLVNY